MRTRWRLLLCASAPAMVALALLLAAPATARMLMTDGLDPNAASQTVLSAVAPRESLEAAGASPSTALELEPMEASLLALLNRDRLEQGLAPLQVDSRLVDLARRRSADMATRQYFGHVTPEGTMVFDLMDREQIPYRLAGENLARNNASPDRSAEVAHLGFMNSPKHAENDYDPDFNRVGIGAARSSAGFIYLTELFAILDR